MLVLFRYFPRVAAADGHSFSFDGLGFRDMTMAGLGFLGKICHGSFLCATFSLADFAAGGDRDGVVFGW
jgi:hypothetical protein